MECLSIFYIQLDLEGNGIGKSKIGDISDILYVWSLYEVFVAGDKSPNLLVFSVELG